MQVNIIWKLGQELKRILVSDAFFYATNNPQVPTTIMSKVPATHKIIYKYKSCLIYKKKIKIIIDAYSVFLTNMYQHNA